MILIDILAVAYRIEGESRDRSDDIIYGEFMAELVKNSKTEAVLKLVKPSNNQPLFEDAWELKMKNIYKISVYLFAKVTVQNKDNDCYFISNSRNFFLEEIR